MYIQASVNERALQTIPKMFSGHVSDRATELIQNSRRSGAENIWITLNGNEVKFRDDGKGIEDFSSILEAGRTDWGEQTEQSEDPAGMGLFCLAPRKVTITSNGLSACIEGDGWRGCPIKVQEVPYKRGTTLEFVDDVVWDFYVVASRSEYSGVTVHFGDRTIETQPFLDPSACTHIPELGVNIEVRGTPRAFNRRVCVNFHGLVLSFSGIEFFRGLSLAHADSFYVLIDMTGEPTPLRLMLPSRKDLVWDRAAEKLVRTCQREVYLWFSTRPHLLSYANYVAARHLGIDIGESEPVVVGPFGSSSLFRMNIFGDRHRVEVGYPLVTDNTKVFLRTYSEDEVDPEDDCLTSRRRDLVWFALGRMGFGLARIPSKYIGYAWGEDMVQVESVVVDIGPELFESEIGEASLVCVEYINYECTLSDGTVKNGSLCVSPSMDGLEPGDFDVHVLVAKEHIYLPADVFDILPNVLGINTEIDNFLEEYYSFAGKLKGRNEPIRRKLHRYAQDCFSELEGEHIYGIDDWESVEIHRCGTVTFRFGDGKELTISDE